MNRTLIEKAKYMLFLANLDGEMWSAAIMATKWVFFGSQCLCSLMNKRDDKDPLIRNHPTYISIPMMLKKRKICQVWAVSAIWKVIL